MQELVERIRAEGVHVGGGLVKLDGFLNHQVDAALTERMGASFFDRFRRAGVDAVDKVITAEVSGIPAALATARRFGVPMLYARKHQSSIMTDVYYLAQASSRTKGADVHLMISKKYLAAGQRVLVIDDFLASGSTIRALCSLIAESGAHLAGIGCVVEKPAEGGRGRLESLGVPVETLARIEFEGDRLVVS